MKGKKKHISMANQHCRNISILQSCLHVFYNFVVDLSPSFFVVAFAFINVRRYNSYVTVTHLCLPLAYSRTYTSRNWIEIRCCEK